MERGLEILRRLPAAGAVRGAEIGVWQGRLSKYLLRGCDRLTLLLVDRWAAPKPGSRYARSSAAIAQYPELDHRIALVNAISRVRFAGARAEIVQGESSEVAKDVPTASLDFAFIDGDHTYDGVLDDLEAWYPKVKPGGWIGGHDWGNRPEVWGVQAAVEYFLGCTGDVVAGVPDLVELGADRTWFFGRPVRAETDRG